MEAISFNQRQLDLESAIGQAKRAARAYGYDTPRGQELAESALRFEALREPEVVAEFERRRRKRVIQSRAPA